MGALPAWSAERPWKWSKKPWHETSPSSQGGTVKSVEILWTLGVVRHLPTKSPWWRGTWGCFLMFCIVPFYWMKGFVFQLLLDILQMDIKPPWRMVSFRSCYILKVFLPCIFPKPDGAEGGAETSLTVLALLQGLKNFLKVPGVGASV